MQDALELSTANAVRAVASKLPIPVSAAAQTKLTAHVQARMLQILQVSTNFRCPLNAYTDRVLQEAKRFMTNCKRNELLTIDAAHALHMLGEPVCTCATNE